MADLMLAMKRIQENTMPIPHAGCLMFMGAVNSRGYGQIKVEDKKLLVHRVAYMALVGPIPDELVIDHKCRNPSCWNPLHLEVVTQAENVFRGFSPHANNARKTECDNGHPFTEGNFRVEPQPNGKVMRRCLICRRARDLIRKRTARARK